VVTSFGSIPHSDLQKSVAGRIVDPRISPTAASPSSTTSKRWPALGYAGIRRHVQDYLVGEQRDGLDLVHAALKKLRGPAIRAWAAHRSACRGRADRGDHHQNRVVVIVANGLTEQAPDVL
jgi:hypothetical protein